MATNKPQKPQRPRKSAGTRPLKNKRPTTMAPPVRSVEDLVDRLLSAVETTLLFGTLPSLDFLAGMGPRFTPPSPAPPPPPPPPADGLGEALTTLGFDPGAGLPSKAEVQARVTELRKFTHPDKWMSAPHAVRVTQEAQFKRIGAAWDVVRARYA